MGGAIAILLLLPALNRSKTPSPMVNPVLKILTYVYFSVFLLLG